MDQLRRLLPICSWCDRIKTDDGKWVGIESYLKKEIGTDITHALCPDCLERELASGGANEGAA